MVPGVLLRIDGEVDRPRMMTFDDFVSVDPRHHVSDVSQLVPKRQGQAVTLAGLLEMVGAKPSANYLTLHSSTDDFHASIPLASVRDQAVLIYGLRGLPLPTSDGGPVRFLIPDVAACHTAEVDECASVKFVDHIEFTVARGHDNRPADDDQHAELHRRADGESAD